VQIFLTEIQLLLAIAITGSVVFIDVDFIITFIIAI